MGMIQRSVCLLTALLMAPFVQAQDAGLPIIPEDIAAEFQAIGRLGNGAFRVRQGCTATLIAPNLIVTAAHCAAETGQSGRVFAAGWSRGDYIAASGTSLEIRHPAYALDGEHNPRFDIALTVLETPMTDVEPIPLGNLEAGDLYGTDAAILGYHRRTPHLLTGDFDCPISRFAEGLLLVGCQVINGNSGGPLLNQTAGGEWQIIGIVSSQFLEGAIVVEIPEWLRGEVATYRLDETQ